MAICRTIRTREGISRFLLPSENGDEYVTAFKCDDNKVEVHSLKKECAPLYLEENTTVNLISSESYGILLVAATPYVATGCLDMRTWDVMSPVGFTPKEVNMKDHWRKEGKYHCSYEVKDIIKGDLVSHISTSSGSLLCFILNGKYCILMKARRLESGAILLDIMTSFLLNDLSPVADALFLSYQQKTYLVLAEGSNTNILSVDDENLTSSNVLQVSMKKSKGTHISQFCKLTCSKCLVIDNVGHLSLLSVPNEITPLKFPSSVGGHGICAVVGFRHTSEGVLAICNNEHTVNLYSLADVLCSITNDSTIYVKPYRSLCNQFPINSITFVKSDQLAVASSVNQSITFWGGLSSVLPS